jgi:hypothetical protein
MATAFGLNLILDVAAGSSSPTQISNRASDIKGITPTGIGINHERQTSGSSDPANVFANVIQISHAKVGQPKRSIGDTCAG